MTRFLLPTLLSVASVAGCASGADVPATADGSGEGSALTASGENPRIERRLTHMQERLDLSEEQVELLRPVLENRHARREELRQSFRHELEGILTPEQLARHDELRAHHRGRFGRHGHRGPGRHGPPDPERMVSRMAEHLELTDAQVEALRPIFEAAHARHQELRELPREERREAFRTIREETKEAVDAVLTEEQRAKLEEHFAGRRGRRGMHRGMRRHRRLHGDFGDGEAAPEGPPPAAE